MASATGGLPTAAADDKSAAAPSTASAKDPTVAAANVAHLLMARSAKHVVNPIND
jgi:hypothetical protein